MEEAENLEHVRIAELVELQDLIEGGELGLGHVGLHLAQLRHCQHVRVGTDDRNRLVSPGQTPQTLFQGFTLKSKIDHRPLPCIFGGPKPPKEKDDALGKNIRIYIG